MFLRYAILGLLDGRELHGYRIKSAFEEQVGPLWPLNFGQIYQTLKDLRRRGLIEGRFDRGTGHIGRWVYTSTAKGRRALETWLARSPRPAEPRRHEMLIRLLALDGKDAASRVAQIARQQQVYRDHLAHLGAQRKLIDDVDTGAPLRALTVDAAIMDAEAHLRWLTHCLHLAEARVGPAAARRTATDPADAPGFSAARA